jgi:hypothetical protein
VQFEEIYTRLEQSQPKTPEDQLFLGLIQAGMDPEAALQTLKAMPAPARHSPVARLARAAAQTYWAQVTGDVKDAEQALEDLRHIVELADDHPLLLATRVNACLATAHAYGPNGSQREAVLQQAAVDVKRMASIRQNPVVAFKLCHYYHFLKDDKGLLRTIQQAHKDRVYSGWMSEFEVELLYRHGDFKGALDVTLASPDFGENPFMSNQQGIVLATIPERKTEAAKAFEDAIRLSKSGSGAAALPGFVQLLGPDYLKTSQVYARDIRNRPDLRIPRIHNDWYNHLLDFHAGAVPGDELLKRAAKNQFNCCEAHFYIGLRRLAEGKRGEAEECFGRSVATGIFQFSEYIWSQAFLSRMKSENNWPPGIDSKKKQ